MAGLAGYKGTLTLYGVAIAELTDLSVEGTREDHDVADLGDFMAVSKGGRLNTIVTGNVNYLANLSCLFNRLDASVSGNINATGAIKIVDPRGSTALSGTGVWLDGGFTMPAGPMVQPFRFAMNTYT